MCVKCKKSMFKPTEKKTHEINSQTLLNTDLFMQKILLCELNSAVQKRLINLNLIFSLLLHTLHLLFLLNHKIMGFIVCDIQI